MTHVIHVTHEAVHQSGGIGTVLRGVLQAPAYRGWATRTLLLGPLGDAQIDAPLGASGNVLYDGRNGPQVGALGVVQEAWGVSLVYGWRRLAPKLDVEVLLVDTQVDPNGIDLFKYLLFQNFGIHSDWYEGIEEYERFLRLAEPGFAGIQALLGDNEQRRLMIAHEFMGLPTAFKAMFSGDRRWETAFYAHEVAVARLLVEERPGRDVMFYNVLKSARAENAFLDEIFGSQEGYYKHALVRQAWRCDVVLAVGDWVAEELRFLGPEFTRRQIDLVYNGLPQQELDLEHKQRSRSRLVAYLQPLFAAIPDYIFTHVTRLVVSKGLWRDLLVLEHLDALLARRGRSAVCIFLATEVGRRSPAQVETMVREWNWPLVHREGYPDLTPKERLLDEAVRRFNSRSRAVKVLFVNQFGWDQLSFGASMPGGMTFADLRQGTDAEFGQSIYEPFGIAQVEPLAFGAISLVSDVCGCCGYVSQAAAGKDTPGFIVGAYTQLGKTVRWPDALTIGTGQVDQSEAQKSRQLANRLALRLPDTPRQQQILLDQGQALARQMSWQRVVADYLLPALDRVPT